MTALLWPRTGRCGACGRRAIAFPSGRWSHVGRPCRARYQTSWTVADLVVSAACRFVADGQPLPTVPDTGVAMAGLAGRLETVRQSLAREAEEPV